KQNRPAFQAGRGLTSAVQAVLLAPKRDPFWTVVDDLSVSVSRLGQPSNDHATLEQRIAVGLHRTTFHAQLVGQFGLGNAAGAPDRVGHFDRFRVQWPRLGFGGRCLASLWRAPPSAGLCGGRRSLLSAQDGNNTSTKRI